MCSVCAYNFLNGLQATKPFESLNPAVADFEMFYTRLVC